MKVGMYIFNKKKVYNMYVYPIYVMKVDQLTKPLDKNLLEKAKLRSYNTYDHELFLRIKRIAALENTTISGMIHRFFEEMDGEYYGK